MALNMDIHQYMYLWITESEPFENGGYLLDGLAFDGDFGFGSDGTRSYRGDLTLLTQSESMAIMGEVSTIHISRKGVKWVLETERILSPPFLLTNNLDINIQFYGKVKADLTDFSRMIFDRDRRGSYPIAGSNFLGIVSYDNSSLLLQAYSENEISINSEKVFFSEWDEEMGTVNLLKDC